MSEENKPKDTRTEFERMVDGEPYHYSEPSVKNRAIEGAEGCKKLNSLDGEEKRAFMREYFTCKPDANFWVSSPFFCEYVSVSLVGLYSDVAYQQHANICEDPFLLPLGIQHSHGYRRLHWTGMYLSRCDHQ